ncbi:hypothetical protein [Burkholderia ubonensis]|uniref:hypothetical protein n=1 Tax=Burkholderia ubonensis TaxID=101571 RepID=UPI000A9B31AE|nr:hypothetical protein [Burkholderia ubonensis]
MFSNRFGKKCVKNAVKNMPIGKINQSVAFNRGVMGVSKNHANHKLANRICGVANSNPCNSLMRSGGLGAVEVGGKLKSLAPKADAYIYAPFSNGDMVIQAMALNVPRVLQGKPCYPILVHGSCQEMTDQVQDFLKTDVIGSLPEFKFIEEAFGCIGRGDIGKLFVRHPGETKRVGEYIALREMEIVSIGDANMSKLKKIYVLGHGEAGSPKIASELGVSADTKTVGVIASELKDFLKKTGRVIDIRMTACESADRETAISMGEKYLNDNSRSCGGRKPLAQHMSDALREKGVEARVFGYHGAAVSRGKEYLHKAVILVGNLAGRPEDFYRASNFRRRFWCVNQVARFPGYSS